MMKRVLLTFGAICLAWGMFAFLADDAEEQRRGPRADRRVAINRVIEAYNIRFHKDIAQTSIIFQLHPNDSIKIECGDCPILMGLSGESKGIVGMSMQSIDGVKPLTAKSFDRWIPINSSNGKVGIVFERDGLGEKVLNLRSIRISAKTRHPVLDEEAVPIQLLDVNNLYIDPLTKDNIELQTTFFTKLKAEDKVQVVVKGADGADPGNLVTSQYKQGEEFDKSPIETGVPLPVPSMVIGVDRFAFEFSHVKDVKGVNAYHIDIMRTPAHSAGYLDIPEDTVVEDTTPPADTLVDDGKEDLFLKYLEKIAGGPNFLCKTPEASIEKNIYGELNMGIGRASKYCVDIELTDECVGDGECIGCDSIWAFWIGSGQDVINRYHFKDSTRKMTSGEGLVEAFVRSKQYRGMQGSGLFPDSYTGESIFFAVVDQFQKDRFLNTPLDEDAWGGDGVFTFSPGAYVASQGFILHYDPARKVSLCVCNKNSLSSVPVVFKYQQFLAEPPPIDSSKLEALRGDFFEMLGDSSDNNLFE